MSSLISLEDRFIGCLFGLAVGDALGAHFEGQPPEYIAERCRTLSQAGLARTPAVEIQMQSRFSWKQLIASIADSHSTIVDLPPAPTQK